MKKLKLLVPVIFALFCFACANKPDFTDFVPVETLEEEKIYYFDNAFYAFEYPGRAVNDFYEEKYIRENDFIPFEGTFIGAPVAGEMHFDESKNEPVIEYITFVVYENDLSQDDCQAYLYNTYGALIAEGAEDDTDGQIYWRRYFTGSKLLKYSKKAKEDFYTITVE